MKFRTEVSIKKSNIAINHQSKIMMLGSCFTNNMGQKLVDNKFTVNLNPMGALYNPQSILQTLGYLMHPTKIEEGDLFQHNGLYHSFLHHGDFSGIDKHETHTKMDHTLADAQAFFHETDILFITFGTAYVFEHIENKEIVSNCHKLPASTFRRYRLSVEDITATWTEFLQKLENKKPNLQIVFTISPIRHLSNGAEDNQLSKATLIYAAQTLAQSLKNAHYFPAYEIMMDDLRDYRFYEEDMVHPNAVAIDYIWNKFKDTYLTSDTEKIIQEWKSIKQAIMHRPFNEESAQHIHFLKQTLLKLKAFGAKYPSICLNSERSFLESKINK